MPGKRGTGTVYCQPKVFGWYKTAREMGTAGDFVSKR